VNYNDKCIHGLPFYACMPCSHWGRNLKGN
jgi:hypothetical protein